ncbi:hypothetical protein EUTSA_v10027176mg [Eutrema salsugineum]|uniref:Uncharacterized protein n=1 Tax=Eutrema salsugineum TaxID=72664 RepID=V4P6B1_EUTSA|nr:putative F-box/kelch-repeat protein At4g22430 [Eutrema salsugineum]ESQ55071.1 hypothetical protein EUTSA_v10027176mg [Eutrema salsugineum]
MERPSNNTAPHDHLVTEILARLPLRSIWRFKSVCKTWKSTVESEYFRRLFLSLHQNSSRGWSLLLLDHIELMDLHRCKTWDLPKSFASYIHKSKKGGQLFEYQACTNGLVFVNATQNSSYVGNPVLQQWVRIPPPPYPYVTLPFGLVTRVDEEDGVVLSFKVVRIAAHVPKRHQSVTYLCLCVYSSETGVWTTKRLDCHHYFTNMAPTMSLNGTLYISPSGFDDALLPGALVAHDFYGESDRCRVIPLPDHNLDHNRLFKRALTCSNGSVMYIKTLLHDLLKVWMLTNNDDDDDSSSSECWQLLWEIRLPFISSDDDILYYAPLAMNPFDRNLVYLWSLHNRYLLSCNLKRQDYKILIGDESERYVDDDDLQNCFVNQSTCDKYMEQVIFGPCSDPIYGIHVAVFHNVLPRWIRPLPCPPQVEMIDTTSLLSYIASSPEQE